MAARRIGAAAARWKSGEINAVAFADAVDRFADAVAELERENAALRLTLNEAATSLCTISQQAGRTDELREMSQIRGYAFSRYSAAIDAARKEKS
jgi:hypothetical protein